MTSLSPLMLDKIIHGLSCVIPRKYQHPMPGDRIHKLASVLAVAGPEELYVRLVSLWSAQEKVVINGYEKPTILTERKSWPQLSDFTETMMYLDTMMYLPDDILVKVDRAGMGVSLETRMPFLDHRLVEFAWRIPMNMKIHNGKGKWLLRQVLKKYLPPELVDRPKMGFGVPIDSWLRGGLRPWAEELLDPDRLARESFFFVEPIRRKWLEHLSGKHNWQYDLWSILMFQAWYESWERGV